MYMYIISVYKLGLLTTSNTIYGLYHYNCLGYTHKARR